MAKVTLVRKNVTATIGEEVKNPLLGEDLPLHSKIQTDGMGLLEFEYKGTTYRITKNTTITLAEIIKSATSSANANYKPEPTTNVSSVRGLSKKKKDKHKKKLKKEENKDK